MVLDLTPSSGNRPRHSTNAQIPITLNMRICDTRPVYWNPYAMALEAPYLHRHMPARTFVCKKVAC